MKYLIYMCNELVKNFTVEMLVFENVFQIHLWLFITRKQTIVNANLKLINAKIHSFYSIDIH